MISTEYEHNGNIVVVHEEEKTEEERAFQQHLIEQATIQFLRKVLEAEARRDKAAQGDCAIVS